jgi:murein DD-endopeptidase MepM/ murein hydrolase activator NlpD
MRAQLRRWSLLPAVLMLAASLAVAPAPARAADCDPMDPICQEIGDAKGQAQQVQNQLDDVKRNLANAQAAIARLDAILKQLQAQRADMEARIKATQGQIDDLARQIRYKEAEIARQEAHIQVREQYLHQRVRAMDKHGRLDYLELFVTSKDFSQLLDRVLIMQDIVRSDQQALVQLKAERETLKGLRNELDGKKKDQEALLAKQREQKAALDTLIGQQNQALALQKQLEAQFEEQRKALEEAIRVANAQVAYLQRQYDLAAQLLGGGSGQFMWPIGTRYITQPFGCSTLLGEPYEPRCATRHIHQGIDLAAPYGSRIFAADAGIANTYSDGYGYGNYVIIVHGNGYSTLYGHMAGFAIRNGAVGRGQVIGYEGSTGYSTGPHLHFEIRYQGNPVNPCLYLGC